MTKPEYVSESDLVNVLSEQEQANLTADYASGSQDTLTKDSAIITEHLRYAESRVESYLTGYELPLDNPPYSIQHAVLVMAAYMLFQRDDMAVSDQVADMYERVIEWLRGVRDGDQALPEAGDEDPADFVGFADKEDMVWDEYPYSDFIPHN